MLAALVACVGLTPTARAQFHMSYEDTQSGHAVGSAFVGGAFRINLQNFDNGVLYNNLGAGNSAGFGQSGTGTQSIPGGISTLDSLAQAPATGAYAQPTTINGVAQPASSTNEDGWGIARIISITDLDGSVIWSETVKNAQLTIMFYGLKDFFVNQTTATSQTIDGVGMHVDLYYQSKTDGAYTQYNPLLGSGGRTGATSYSTVTDGEMILSAVSVPGFIHDDGTLGGKATEFESKFNATSGGDGEMYMSVTGGTRASEFDNNDFDAPYIAGQTADLFGQFTTALSSTADWLARSNDPIVGSFQPVPEPSTYGLAGAALLSGIVAFRRRFQKRAIVNA
jgi:hypothetical protein